MGVQAVCTSGYPTSICRCRKKHDPVEVVECYDRHRHANLYTGSGPGAQQIAKTEPVEIVEYEEWQPLVESGAVIKPRPSHDALKFYFESPPGSTFSDGEPRDGVVGIRKRTVRIEYGSWITVV